MTTPPPSQEPKPPRDAGNWAQPVNRLKVRTLPLDAINLNVEGRALAGPLQGFGPLWQKTYSIRLEGVETTPAEVIRIWKANFARFWPGRNRFYAPITGIAPGEVAVLNLEAPVGMTLSTGVMVIYADAESFSFITPEGHMFAAMITFSAYDDNGVTVVQIQPLIRSSDPLWEVAMRVYGFRQEDRFWERTLRRLGAYFGVTDQPVALATVCLDPRYQWSQALNIWQNAAIRSSLYALAAPVRLARRQMRRRAQPGPAPVGESALPAEGAPRDAPYWARPVERLKVSDAVPAGAINLNVEGRAVSGALQGFGQLWQKTYRVRFAGLDITPEDVMASWKTNFPRFQPRGNNFWPTGSGIAPGEVLLIDTAVAPAPGLPGMIPMASGVMILYADDTSFTVMTPQGFPESGWNTFSAYTDADGVTVAQVQSMARATDPVYEFWFQFMGSSAMQEQTWHHVLRQLAAHWGIDDAPVEMHKVCLDSRVQWKQAKNIWHNAGLRSTLYLAAAPARWLRSRGQRPGTPAGERP